MKGFDRLQFLAETIARHPDSNYAFDSERPIAQELTRLGWLSDLDDLGHPGCFKLTPAGERAAAALELQISTTSFPNESSLMQPDVASSEKPAGRGRPRKKDTQPQ